jgi:hypothetical protein
MPAHFFMNVVPLLRRVFFVTCSAQSTQAFSRSVSREDAMYSPEPMTRICSSVMPTA